MLWLNAFFLYIPFVYCSTTNRKPHIIDGLEAASGQFPWQAALYAYKSAGIYLCSGSIISPEWILTAASCIDGSVSMVAYTGSVARKEGTKSQVVESIWHANFNSSTLRNDIGLIRLSPPLTFDEHTSAIKLAQFPLDSGVEVVVSGWGITAVDNTAPSSTLNYVYLSTITDTLCAAYYGNDHIYDEILCAESEVSALTGPCEGDAGGPLVSDFDTAPVLAGIYSFGRCKLIFPFGFTEIVFYTNWIQEVTGIAIEDSKNDL